MKNFFQIGFYVLILVFLVIVIFFVNAFYGNPISKILANNAVKKYVAENFKGMDLKLEKAFYNFKDGRYHVRVGKEASEDINFVIETNYKGEVVYDNYESEVLSGFNTWRRLADEYRKLGDTVLLDENFPYESDISYTILNMYEKNEPYGIKMSELELDKEYDIKELGRKYGEVVIYLYDEDVSVKKASEMMLGVKKLLDDGCVPFKTMDFNLSLPKEEGKPRNFDIYIGIENFLYEEIYEEGLEERIEKADKELKEYYKELDKTKR